MDEQAVRARLVRDEMGIANPEIDEILARRYWSIDNIPYNKPGDASHRRYTAEIDEIEDELTALVGDEELMIALCQDYEDDDGEEFEIFSKLSAEQQALGRDDELTMLRCVRELVQRQEWPDLATLKYAKRRIDGYESADRQTRIA